MTAHDPSAWPATPAIPPSPHARRWLATLQPQARALLAELAAYDARRADAERLVGGPLPGPDLDVDRALLARLAEPGAARAGAGPSGARDPMVAA